MRARRYRQRLARGWQKDHGKISWLAKSTPDQRAELDRMARAKDLAGAISLTARISYGDVLFDLVPKHLGIVGLLRRHGKIGAGR